MADWPGGAPAVSFERVSFTYGVAPVLSDLSFEIGPQVASCRRPTGAGKTTLTRLIAGLYDPTVGVIR